RRHLEELGAALRLVDVVAADAAAGVVLGEQLLHLGEVRRVEAAEIGDSQALARLDVGQALDLSGEGGEVGGGHGSAPLCRPRGRARVRAARARARRRICQPGLPDDGRAGYTSPLSRARPSHGGAAAALPRSTQMYIGYSEEQERLRQELRAYYDRLLTPAVREDLIREHGIGPKTKAVRQQMALDGWLCFGWPKEY